MRHVRSLARPVFSETGQLVEYVGTLIDMTERVHADEALRRSQQDLAHVTRVLNLGALTASIGHDLSQFVAAIETNSSACLRWLSREQPNVEEAAAAVRRIMRDAGLVAEVIGNIRAFLQKTAGTKIDVDVADVVRETRLLVEAEAASQRVVIEESIGEGLPSVLAVRVELLQVLLNLMLNAVEAMAEVAERPRILRIHCALGIVEHAPAVVVGIEDSGPGFATVDPERLFDAFYTTKPQGLGMGLSIARSIVEAHGGRLWPTPNAEHGVTFHFTIPLARQP
jgi:C4-dicarboxylate-specific signal transduction histidine kinase